MLNILRSTPNNYSNWMDKEFKQKICYQLLHGVAISTTDPILFPKLQGSFLLLSHS